MAPKRIAPLELHAYLNIRVQVLRDSLKRTLEHVHAEFEKAAQPEKVKLQVPGANLNIWRQNCLQEEEEGR